jgi:DNA-binding NtrC family response regulator
VGCPVKKINELNILVVDDHTTTLATTRLMLNQLGVAEIHLASDGRQAMEVLDRDEKVHIDMIICDWNMPHMSGVELLRQVRSVDAEIPFLMITGRGDLKSIEEAQKSRVSGYILKPFSLAEIEKKITYLLTHPKTN